MLPEEATLQRLPEAQGQESAVAVDGEKRPIFYFAPLADMSISGQRG